MRHLMDEPVSPTSAPVSPEALRGFPAVLLAVAGMECPSCANRVRNVLMAHPGVLEVEADASAALARVWLDPQRVSVREILGIVTALGERTHHQFFAIVLRTPVT